MSTETHDRARPTAATRRAAGDGTAPARRSRSPTAAPARPTSCRSQTAPCARSTCARSRSTTDEFGLMAYDPAFMNTASCRSSITYIDGDAGILQHRGYPIEQLCEHSTYLEVAYLLINGRLPTQAELRAGSTRSRSTPSCTRTSRTSCRASATTPTRWACSSPPSARSRPSTPTPTRSTTSASARSRSSGCWRRCRRSPRSPSATTWASPTSTPTTTSTTPATSSG